MWLWLCLNDDDLSMKRWREESIVATAKATCLYSPSFDYSSLVRTHPLFL